MDPIQKKLQYCQYLHLETLHKSINQSINDGNQAIDPINQSINRRSPAINRCSAVNQSINRLIEWKSVPLLFQPVIRAPCCQAREKNNLFFVVPNSRYDFRHVDQTPGIKDGTGSSERSGH
jgi:hypothetical protein